METNVYKDDANNWVTPLPFRELRQCLPNNRDQAVKRFASLERSFKRKPEMEAQYVAFMESVLLRFRKERVAILADIQQMFHFFLVLESHRNFLRFLWYQDNDLSKPVVEYRMKVHVFGNALSPAVAIYGLRRNIVQTRWSLSKGTFKLIMACCLCRLEQKWSTCSNVHKPHFLSQTYVYTSLCQTVKQSLIISHQTIVSTAYLIPLVCRCLSQSREGLF